MKTPLFRYYQHGKGEKPAWQASTFQSWSNTWHTYAAWPPREAVATNLYLHADGTLSFMAPGAAESGAFREYVSDPANPVPYRQRPFSPTYPAGDWRTWETADQRFVEGRPDVLTWVSAPLDRDLTITGPVSADLFASTSGTDADFVLKLIDVYPEKGDSTRWDPEAGPAPGAFRADHERLRAPDRNGDSARALSRELREAERAKAERADRLEDSAARSRPRF